MYGSVKDPITTLGIRDSQRPGVTLSTVSFSRVEMNRSGTNSAGQHIQASRLPGPEAPWVLKTFKDPHGRFTDTIVRYRKNGSPVIRRIPVRITRLVPVRSKVKASRGQDIPPNPLKFELINLINFKDDSIGYHWRGRTGTISGPIGTEWFDISSDSIAVGIPAMMGKNGVERLLSYAQAPNRDWVRDAEAKALNKLYAEAQDMKANIAVMLAESRQTAESLVGAVKRLVEMVDAFKKGKFTTLVKRGATKKKISGQWLEAVYGYVPLISDIQGCIEAIKQGRKPIVQDVNGRGKISAEKVVFESSGPYMDETITCRETVKVRYKARIMVTNQGSKLLNETGLDNPPVVFWEKVPWSFVVDWFLPVGNYLELRDAFTGTRTVFVTRTISRETVVKCERRFKGYTPYPNFWFTQDKTVTSEVRKFSVEREILSAIPGLDFPHFKNPCSGMHIANGLALLVQKYSR